MKKFFKGLALVLAFALIVASANGFAVKAAKKIKLNKKSVELNVAETVKVKVKNLPAGYAVKFVSKDATVATVNKKGKITAIGGGETKVVAKIKDAAGKLVAKKKCAVAVLAKCEKIALNAPATAVVGAKAFENVATTPAKVSDEIKYFVNGEEVAADYAYEKAGKYELKVTCNFNEDTATVEVTPVIVEAKDAKQKSATEFIMTMEKEVVKEDLGAATVTYDVNGASVAVAVKELVIIPADKTQVKVVLYSNMKEEANYKLVYGKNKFEIKTASLKVKDAAGIKQTGTSVTYNEQAKLPFEVVTAEGVEIPYDVYSGFLTLTASDPTVAAISNSGVAKTGYTAFFYAKNTSTNVKFEFKGYYVDGTETKLNEFTENLVFQGVESVELPVSKVEWGFDAKKENKKLVMGENGTIKFYAEATNEYGEVVKKYNLADVTFVSSNNSVVVINGTTFQPVSVGSAQVMVYADYNNDLKKRVIQVIDVTVDPERVPTSITIEYTKQLLNSTTAAFATGDSLDVKFYVKDQYGVGMNDAILKASKLSDSNDTLVNTSDIVLNGKTKDDANGKAGFLKWTIDNTNLSGKAGTFSYKIVAEKEVKSGATKTSAPATVVITTKSVPSTVNKSKQFTLSKTSVDTFFAKKNDVGDGLVKASGIPSIDVKMYDISNDGYALSDSVDVDWVSADPASVSAGAVKYGFKVLKSDGTALDNKFCADGKISAWDVTKSSDVKKLATGTYTVQIWEYKQDGTNVKKVMLKSFTFAVTDSEFAYTVEQKEDAASDYKSAFKFYYTTGILTGEKTDAGAEQTPIDWVTTDGTDAVFVKSVKFNVTAGSYTYVLETPVNAAILKK